MKTRTVYIESKGYIFQILLHYPDKNPYIMDQYEYQGYKGRVHKF
jgi:hypothetical protein